MAGMSYLLRARKMDLMNNKSSTVKTDFLTKNRGWYHLKGELKK